MRVWLQDLRTKRGYTMKYVADKLGISESYYCAIENGTRQKNMDIMLATGLSVVLGVPVSQICIWERELHETNCSGNNIR